MLELQDALLEETWEKVRGGILHYNAMQQSTAHLN